MISARERVRKTPCRLRVTLFSSSESPREQKGVGVRRQTLKGLQVGMQFPESVGNCYCEKHSYVRIANQDWQLASNPSVLKFVKANSYACQHNYSGVKWLWNKTLWSLSFRRLLFYSSSEVATQKTVVDYLEHCMQLITEKEVYKISGSDVKPCPI